MPAQFISGKNAIFTIAGTSLSTIGWTIQANTEKATFKNSNTGSFPQFIGTFLGGKVTLNYDHNLNNTAWAAPISIESGDVITAICYLNGTSGQNWNFTSLFVDETPQSITVDGKPVSSIQCSIQGPYTPPNGTLVGTSPT